METLQYMTPEGLLEFVLQDGVPVCLNESKLSSEEKPSLSCEPPPPPQIEDLLRFSTLRLVRACCASHERN